MILTSFALAAATPALDFATEQDLRCVVVSSLLLGHSQKTEKTVATQKFALISEYFFGKLDVRAPDLDLMSESLRIMRAGNYDKEIETDFKRCEAEFLKHEDRLRRNAERSP